MQSRRTYGLPKGQKRTPEQLEQVTGMLLSYIQKHPGERTEAIGRGLRMKTSELVLPVKKLRAAKRIKVRGEKRATTYSPRAF